GQPVHSRNGYVAVERAWRASDRVELDLAMPPRLTEPHPRVESSYGTLAIERGPLVYCIEHANNASVLDALLDADAPLETRWEPDLLGGITTIHARGSVRDMSDWPRATFASRGRSVTAQRADTFTAIPYYA